jgi:hypothetical protein
VLIIRGGERMSYKLNIVDNNLKVNANVRYENLSRQDRPEVIAKTPQGKVAKEKSVINGKVIQLGEMTRQWVDEDGKIYGKTELTFWYNNDEVKENQQTKVFEITGYQPLANYTDNYVISSYYEVFPDDNGMKKDFDRERATNSNLFQMRKLWEYLDTNQVVARGEFCTSSRGFVASDGYIRAIKFNGSKWGVEIGIFKEEKIFQHLNEGLPTEVKETVSARKKIKMV